MAYQQEQIRLLKQITGIDFSFMPMEKSDFRVPSYVASIKDDELLNLNMGTMKNYIIFYHEGENKVILADNAADYDRLQALTTIIMKNNDSLASIKEYVTPIGKVNGKNVYLEPLPTNQNLEWSPIVEQNRRAISVVNINGARLPFYVSSGLAGKEQEYGIASGKWYPLQGVSSGWLNKMQNMNHNPYKELDEIADLLNKKYQAKQIREEALEGKLPLKTLNNTDFMKITNADFPEGVNETNQPSFTYYLNKEKYLPRIIRKWRGKEVDSFSQTDELKNEHDKKAEKIGKILSIDAYSDGDVICFNTQKNIKEIEKELNFNGIHYESSEYINYADSNVIGLYIDSLMLPTNLNKMAFEKGKQEVEKKSQKALIKNIKKLLFGREVVSLIALCVGYLLDKGIL